MAVSSGCEGRRRGLTGPEPRDWQVDRPNGTETGSKAMPGWTASLESSRFHANNQKGPPKCQGQDCEPAWKAA